MAGSSIYRVSIDISKIQSNVYAQEGGRLSETAVRNWLRSVGFKPETGRTTWLADKDVLGRLDKSEIRQSRRVQHGRPVSNT
jgi:hypothetical protein